MNTVTVWELVGVNELNGQKSRHMIKTGHDDERRKAELVILGKRQVIKPKA